MQGRDRDGERIAVGEGVRRRGGHSGEILGDPVGLGS